MTVITANVTEIKNYLEAREDWARALNGFDWQSALEGLIELVEYDEDAEAVIELDFETRSVAVDLRPGIAGGIGPNGGRTAYDRFAVTTNSQSLELGDSFAEDEDLLDALANFTLMAGYDGSRVSYWSPSDEARAYFDKEIDARFAQVANA